MRRRSRRSQGFRSRRPRSADTRRRSPRRPAPRSARPAWMGPQIRCALTWLLGHAASLRKRAGTATRLVARAGG
eukprot:1267118-Prymnesium_polylepis.1